MRILMQWLVVVYFIILKIDLISGLTCFICSTMVTDCIDSRKCKPQEFTNDLNATRVIGKCSPDAAMDCKQFLNETLRIAKAMSKDFWIPPEFQRMTKLMERKLVQDNLKTFSGCFRMEALSKKNYHGFMYPIQFFGCQPYISDQVRKYDLTTVFDVFPKNIDKCREGQFTDTNTTLRAWNCLGNNCNVIDLKKDDTNCEIGAIGAAEAEIPPNAEIELTTSAVTETTTEEKGTTKGNSRINKSTIIFIISLLFICH